MRRVLENIFGAGFLVGLALILIGFVLWFFGCAYKIALMLGGVLWLAGFGYLQIEEEEK